WLVPVLCHKGQHSLCERFGERSQCSAFESKDIQLRQISTLREVASQACLMSHFHECLHMLCVIRSQLIQHVTCLHFACLSFFNQIEHTFDNVQKRDPAGSCSTESYETFQCHQTHLVDLRFST